MKSLFIFFTLTFCYISTKAQANNDSSFSKNLVSEEVWQNSGTIDQIALQIQKNYKSPRDRLMAIHSWVARNIVYDTDSMYLINWRLSEEAAIAETMRRRRGVCQNYALIFNALARSCGFESFIVDGFTIQHGRADKTGHTWVAVNCDNEWAFCDPTWDKDNPSSLQHFLISPAVFIETHMPFDPIWQLLPYEVTFTAFTNGNTYNQKNKPVINFRDNVASYALLSPLQKMEAAYRRMKKNAAASQLYRNQVAYVNMKISIEYEAKDIQLYDLAINDFNTATRLLNRFLTYRNDGLLPSKSFLALSTDLDEVAKKIKSAYKSIGDMGRVIPDDACDPSALKDRVENLEHRLKQEKLFLQNYFAGNNAAQIP